MSEELYDVIIIGGGPGGLSAAQYAARAGLKTIVLDKSPTAGALAFASRIENYPGIEGAMSGKELLDLFRRQADGFGADYIETQVMGVNLGGNVKEVFDTEKTYSGKTVIIATGSMGRKPTIKGEAAYLGKGVSYCAVCDAAFFKGKTVCVVGSSEEAVKEAGYLAKFAEKVLLISPINTLKVEDGHPTLQLDNVEVLLSRSVVAIQGSDVVERIRLLDAEKNERELELSGVFLYTHGNRPIVDFLIGSVDVNIEECVAVNRFMETSIPGVFAAGDVICTEVRQVVVSAANGCMAALSAEKFISHRKRTRHDWAVKSEQAQG